MFPSASVQRDIAAKIVEKKADYILALKGNQGTLRDDVEVFVDEQKARKYKDTTISTTKRSTLNHGRIETRNYTVIHNFDWLQARHEWPGLSAVVVVESLREINGKITSETRFYITSLAVLANVVGPIIRAHWPSRTLCIGSWTWSFATNAASEPTTHQPIRDLPAHRLQSQGARQGFHPAPAQNLRVGRRISRNPRRRVISFTRFPWFFPR
jgi:predicted transposase YbfD/YdcC